MRTAAETPSCRCSTAPAQPSTPKAGGAYLPLNRCCSKAPGSSPKMRAFRTMLSANMPCPPAPRSAAATRQHLKSMPFRNVSLPHLLLDLLLQRLHLLPRQLSHFRVACGKYGCSNVWLAVSSVLCMRCLSLPAPAQPSRGRLHMFKQSASGGENAKI